MSTFNTVINTLVKQISTPVKQKVNEESERGRREREREGRGGRTNTKKELDKKGGHAISVSLK